MRQMGTSVHCSETDIGSGRRRGTRSPLVCWESQEGHCLCVCVCFHAQSSPVETCTSMFNWLGRERRRRETQRRRLWLWSGVTCLWQHSSLQTAETCHSWWNPAGFNLTWIQTHTHTRKQMLSLCSTYSLWALCSTNSMHPKPVSRCHSDLPEDPVMISWIMEGFMKLKPCFFLISCHFRTESVAEKMLTNWFAFLLHKFLKVSVGVWSACADCVCIIFQTNNKI